MSFSLRKKTVFLVLFITFVTHIPYINNGFTWLDHNDIETGAAILPINKLHQAFFSPFGQTSFYRPVVTIANSIDSFLYQKRAAGFHFSNLLLHLGVVSLVALFLSVFFHLSLEQKFLASLIFGVHPGSILVVGSLTQRQEPLFLIFTMLTLYFHKKARETKKWSYIFLTLAVFMAALTSKETAIVIIPALIVFWEVLNKKKQEVRLFLFEFLIVISYVILRINFVPTVWGTQAPGLSFTQNIGTTLGLLLKWILLLISPFKPNFSDAVPVLGLVNIYTVSAILALFSVLVIILRSGFTSNISKSLILILIFLAPGMNIIPVPRIGSPHYIYLPVVGFAALIVVLLVKLNNKSLKFIIATWLIVSAISVFKAGFQFKNDETLFKPEVEKDVNFYEGHYYLGNYYLKMQDLDNAEKEFELGVREDASLLAFRNNWTMLVNLAGVKLEKGKLDEAEAIYKKAEKEIPDSMADNLLYNFALIAYKKGDYKRVVELLSHKDLSTPQAYLLLENSLQILNRNLESQEVLRTPGN